MTPMPFIDCDSMCSMLLTVVVIDRSVKYTMRSDMSCADRPEYCQMTLMTGMSMLGKMSVGVRENDHGRQDEQHQRQDDERVRSPRARRTIHITSPRLRYRKGFGPKPDYRTHQQNFLCNTVPACFINKES